MLTTTIGSVYHIEGSIVNEVFRRLFTIIQQDIAPPILMIPPPSNHIVINSIVITYPAI